MKITNKRLRLFLAGIAGLALNWSGSVAKAHKRIKEGDILPLYFHNPDKNLFKKIIIWLNENGFDFISTQELVHLMKSNTEPETKMVWITFDDGWQNNIENVVPTLIEYDVPATFFISTYPVEYSGFFWWSAVKHYNRKRSSKSRLNLDDLWQMPWPEIKNCINETIGDEKLIPREAMTVQEVIEISKLPQVTIGCHGIHHLLTTRCSEAELASELLESKSTLERWIEMPVRYFSYPKGIFGEREKSYLVNHGYELAASTNTFLISKYTDPFSLPRFGVLNEAYFCEAICHILGIWQPFKNRFRLSHKISVQ